MANPAFFHEVFDSLATGGFIGDPNGLPAYAYLRVSSKEQAEEGRSGLPRQIKNCHDIAAASGFRIAWEMVFADDDSGFDLDRPSLTQLRREYASSKRRANVIVIEYLDRLSRNADWHQGFLLDEMKKRSITPVFWKGFSSRIERAVIGAISQDAMELARERMEQGRVDKAKVHHLVTAKRPAYGLKLVDSQGHEGAHARQDTHYAIKEGPEVLAVRYIFNRIGKEAAKARRVAAELDQLGYPTPLKSKHWRASTILKIVHNPVYKGESITNQWRLEKRKSIDENGIEVKVNRMVQRPPEEWIVVPVPALIEPALWELANRMLQKNQQMAARRAGDSPFLLTGLVRCATCGRSYNGNRGRDVSPKGKVRYYPKYCCSSQRDELGVRNEKRCHNGNIKCQTLDDAVWRMVCEYIHDPAKFERGVDVKMQAEKNADRLSRIEYLEGQIAKFPDEDEALWRGFRAGGFDEHEFASRRNALKADLARWTSEVAVLKEAANAISEREAQRRFYLENVKQKAIFLPDASFEVRRQMIALLIERITINVREDWMEIEGGFSGRFCIVPISGYEYDRNARALSFVIRCGIRQTGQVKFTYR